MATLCVVVYGRVDELNSCTVSTALSRAYDQSELERLLEEASAPFDVALIDASQEGALEALKLIQERFDSCTTILLAGESEAACVVKALEAGLDQYLLRMSSPTQTAAVLNATLAATLNRRPSLDRIIEERLRHVDKMHGVARLAKGVAHDFNNVLTVISSHCYMVSQEGVSDKDFSWSLEKITSAAERGTELTRQLMSLGRARPRNVKDLDLNETIEEMRGLLQTLLGKNVSLSLELDKNGRRIVSDPRQIQQILMNLALNSRDAIHRSGQVTIRTSSRPQGEDPGDADQGMIMVLEFSDNGHGIAPEIQERIFEPFFTTKKAGEGSGLGLATLSSVMSQDRGGVAVHSVPGEGATFILHWPSLESTHLEPTISKPLAQPREGRTILLVEDEDDLRQPIRKLLESRGFRVIEACSGEEAQVLSRGHGGPISLLLSDVFMPGINGLELADKLGSERPEMEVILMSGYIGDFVVGPHKGRRLLEKPFGIDILSEAIHEVLSSRA